MATETSSIDDILLGVKTATQPATPESALDEISERTPEDCVNILVKRSAIDNTICDFYEKHPEIKD